MVIYEIKNTQNNKFYIGSTKNFKKRRSEHLWALRKNRSGCTKLQNAWNKHGEANFQFTVLEEINDIKDLIPREQHYIDKLKPEYNIKKIADSWKGLPRPDMIAKNKERSSKPIDQYTLDGVFIRTWESMAVASRALSTDRSQISQCCRGVSNQAKGYKFTYKGKPLSEKQITRAKYETVDERNTALSKSNVTNYNTYSVVCNGKESIVENLKLFCEESKVDYTTALRASRGVRQQPKGYIFKLVKKNKIEIKWPSKQKLKLMLNVSNFSEIGKILKCSGNSVKYHARKIGLIQ